MKKFSFYLFFLFFLLSFLIVTLALLKLSQKRATVSLQIGGQKILVEVVKTKAEQEKGLSGKESLPPRTGMLFVYDQLDYRSFWMKEMNFSLDFVWIREGKIVAITENINPQDYQPPQALKSPEPVDQVLELNAGEVKKLDLEVGQEVLALW